MACWAGGQPGQSAALAARLPCHLVHDRLPVARILVYEFLEALPFEFEFMDIEVHDELNRALVDFANPEIGWDGRRRSEEHTSELQSLMRISYAVFCLKT